MTQERKRVPVFYVPFRPIYRRGIACYWFILIRSKYSGDLNLLHHEEIHISQQRNIGLLKYLWRYYTDKRFVAEVEYAAFKYGSKYTDRRIKHILENNYNVPIDVINEVIG